MLELLDIFMNCKIKNRKYDCGFHTLRIQKNTEIACATDLYKLFEKTLSKEGPGGPTKASLKRPPAWILM